MGGPLELLRVVHRPRLVLGGWLEGRVWVLFDVRLVMESAAEAATLGNATDGAEVVVDGRIEAGARRSSQSLDA